MTGSSDKTGVSSVQMTTRASAISDSDPITDMIKVLEEYTQKEDYSSVLVDHVNQKLKKEINEDYSPAHKLAYIFALRELLKDDPVISIYINKVLLNYSGLAGMDMSNIDVYDHALKELKEVVATRKIKSRPEEECKNLAAGVVVKILSKYEKSTHEAVIDSVKKNLLLLQRTFSLNTILYGLKDYLQKENSTTALPLVQVAIDYLNLKSPEQAEIEKFSKKLLTDEMHRRTNSYFAHRNMR